MSNPAAPKLIRLTAFFLILIASPGGVSTYSLAGQQQPKSLARPATGSYAAILKTYVNPEGMVNYKALKENRAALDQYVTSLGGASPAVTAGSDEKKQIAFWINAYNAITLQSIVDHYPIHKGGLVSGLRFPENSIRQIAGVWDAAPHSVLGAPMTLEQIEHGTLRKKFSEPRIHMALVCAAMGCPPLRNEPYDGARLDAQLDDQGRKFFANPKKFRIDRAKNVVYLSSIFKWFAEDFARQNSGSEFARQPAAVRGVLAFAARYASPEDAQYLKTKDYTIEYLDYDWSLNEP